MFGQKLDYVPFGSIENAISYYTAEMAKMRREHVDEVVGLQAKLVEISEKYVDVAGKYADLLAQPQPHLTS